MECKKLLCAFAFLCLVAAVLGFAVGASDERKELEGTKEEKKVDDENQKGVELKKEDQKPVRPIPSDGKSGAFIRVNRNGQQRFDWPARRAQQKSRNAALTINKQNAPRVLVNTQNVAPRIPPYQQPGLWPAGPVRDVNTGRGIVNTGEFHYDYPENHDVYDVKYVYPRQNRKLTTKTKPKKQQHGSDETSEEQITTVKNQVNPYFYYEDHSFP
ncbi:uncharacterized protein LOC132196224 isoform X2 [Neocloeon triangulifer]|uniref:uncharacterized protein LOC132196224 isoform X2 n=1 Tax=Neocloeon triangulifer TaxID=2078957 RepID=UPI00286F8AAF|nr:uncharacterized protein LOC132196224 isoform X2 [Neocloeon triangulifer]